MYPPSAVGISGTTQQTGGHLLLLLDRGNSTGDFWSGVHHRMGVKREEGACVAAGFQEAGVKMLTLKLRCSNDMELI